MKGKTVYTSGKEGESKRETQGIGRRKDGERRGEENSGEKERVTTWKKIKKVKKKMDEMIKVDGETTT